MLRYSRLFQTWTHLLSFLVKGHDWILLWSLVTLVKRVRKHLTLTRRMWWYGSKEDRRPCRTIPSAPLFITGFSTVLVEQSDPLANHPNIIIFTFIHNPLFGTSGKIVISGIMNEITPSPSVPLFVNTHDVNSVFSDGKNSGRRIKNKVPCTSYFHIHEDCVFAHTVCFWHTISVVMKFNTNLEFRHGSYAKLTGFGNVIAPSLVTLQRNCLQVYFINFPSTLEILHHHRQLLWFQWKQVVLHFLREKLWLSQT